mmetsp:Transcript_116987/g.162592  ORF Transcript_116987/g.162592 Transcript_116987/m.162592 type:complete len:90 (-) Transcript_116987:360-629(-)
MADSSRPTAATDPAAATAPAAAATPVVAAAATAAATSITTAAATRGAVPVAAATRYAASGVGPARASGVSLQIFLLCLTSLTGLAGLPP